MRVPNNNNGITNVVDSNHKKTNLECGTSLAELEYTTELDEKQRQILLTEEEETKDVIFKKAKNEHFQTTQQVVDLIRSSISKDIVTNDDDNDDNSITMFTSPFETPEARRSINQAEIPEVERYASVPLIYCDQTASNRPLKSIEKFIYESCLPMYGNTHTNTSVTGSQSTAFVAEARQIVAEGVNAKISGKAALDVVLFA